MKVEGRKSWSQSIHYTGSMAACAVSSVKCNVKVKLAPLEHFTPSHLTPQLLRKYSDDWTYSFSADIEQRFMIEIHGRRDFLVSPQS